MKARRLALALILSAAPAPAPCAEPGPPSADGAPYDGATPGPGVPPAVRERDPGSRFTVDVSLSLASGNSVSTDEPLLGGGLHVTGRPGPIVLAADFQGGTNVLGSDHAFVAAGIGRAVDLEAGRIVLTALYGVHSLKVVELFADGTEHELRALGLRAALEGEAGRRVRVRLGVAVTGYFDLEREYDAGVGGDVGGATFFLSFALGLGL